MAAKEKKPSCQRRTPLSALNSLPPCPQIGIGRFHYFVLLLCGWANAADAVELLAVRSRRRGDLIDSPHLSIAFFSLPLHMSPVRITTNLLFPPTLTLFVGVVYHHFFGRMRAGPELSAQGDQAPFSFLLATVFI